MEKIIISSVKKYFSKSEIKVWNITIVFSFELFFSNAWNFSKQEKYQ